MTSARKRPAGTPEDREARQPAGTPDDRVAEGDRERDPGDGELFSHSESKSPIEDEASAEAVDADLDALLADVKRERDEYLELAQRTKADFENYRKRAARQTTEAEQRGKASLARDLLPAVDNLERALRAVGVDVPGTPPSDEQPAAPISEEVTAQEALARGVALVLGELQATLERAGVETYDPAGERFDPTWHEALSTRADDAAESGTVLETLERGYRLDGQVLRPARVVVSE